MTNQTPIAKPNVIGAQDLAELATLADRLKADLEVITNEETGDHIASLMYLGEARDEAWEVHFIPDPYSSTGCGWAAVSNERAVATANTLAEVIEQYREGGHSRVIKSLG